MSGRGGGGKGEGFRTAGFAVCGFGSSRGVRLVEYFLICGFLGLRVRRLRSVWCLGVGIQVSKDLALWLCKALLMVPNLVLDHAWKGSTLQDFMRLQRARHQDVPGRESPFRL